MLGQPILQDGEILLQNNPCIVISSNRKCSFQRTIIDSEILQTLSEQIKLSDSFVYEKHFSPVFSNFPSILSNSNEDKNIHSFTEYGLFVKRLIRTFESKNQISQIYFFTKLLEVIEDGIKKEQRMPL